MAAVPDGIRLERHRDLEGRGWHIWVARVLLGLIAVLLVLALFNLFGQRPLTSRAGNGQAVLSVYSPARVRGGLLYTARFHVSARADLKKVSLLLDPGWVEGMQINSINPQPVDEASNDGRLYLDLGHIPAGHSAIYFIEFQVNPTNIGHRSQNVELDNNGKRLLFIKRTITIYP